jgi:hypothetical protein
MVSDFWRRSRTGVGERGAKATGYLQSSPPLIGELHLRGMAGASSKVSTAFHRSVILYNPTRLTLRSTSA